jgi:hypothetical protein
LNLFEGDGAISFKLKIPTLGSNFRSGGQEDFHIGLWKDRCPNIPSFTDNVLMEAKAALDGEEIGSNHGVSRDNGGGGSYFWGTYVVRGINTGNDIPHALPLGEKVERVVSEESRDSGLVMNVDVVDKKDIGHSSVEGPCV